MPSSFWTDLNQANQRLNSSVVMFRDTPTYIRDVGGDGAHCYLLPKQENIVIRLNDEGWNDYRNLPRLGWVNLYDRGHAVFMERRPRRNSTHGLCNQNVHCYQSTDNGPFVNARPFTDYIFDQGFADATAGKFDDMREVLSYLKEGSIVGISNNYAVGRDQIGIPYLMHRMKKIGVIIEDSIRLPDSVSYLREELMAEEALKFELKSL